MKTKTYLKTALLPILVSIIVISSMAFVINISELPGPQDPVKLAYNYAEGKSVSYTLTTAVTQAMDVSGQTMNVLVNNNMAFKVKMLGKSDENLKLEITVDSLSTKVESPQGSAGGKIKDVEGKTFNMVLSPLGKEIDVNEAAKIEYTVEGSGGGNMSQSFASIFPDLPGNPVKPGDTWTKNDTISNNSATTKVKQIIQSTNKFEGIEKIDGLECAKITSTITGTMQTTTQNMGMDIFYNGPLQGTVTLYFAVKEGYFVKQEVLTKMTGTIEISGPQSMTFPVVMDTSSKIEANK